MKLKKNKLSYLLFLFLAMACDTNFTPKPKAFNRIDLPPHKYQKLKDSSLPYHFQYSKIALVIKDTTGNKKEKELYRIVHYPAFDCNIHLTYKPIKESIDTLNSYISEGYRLRDGHDKKAYGFDERYDTTDLGYQLAAFELEGNVPSPFQFMVHDSTTHFLRGALYFQVATKNDSLAPVINYVKEDIYHMINTIDWKNSQ